MEENGADLVHFWTEYKAGKTANKRVVVAGIPLRVPCSVEMWEKVLYAWQEKWNTHFQRSRWSSRGFQASTVTFPRCEYRGVNGFLIIHGMN